LSYGGSHVGEYKGKAGCTQIVFDGGARTARLSPAGERGMLTVRNVG